MTPLGQLTGYDTDTQQENHAERGFRALRAALQHADLVSLVRPFRIRSRTAAASRGWSAAAKATGHRRQRLGLLRLFGRQRRHRQEQTGRQYLLLRGPCHFAPRAPGTTSVRHDRPTPPGATTASSTIRTTTARSTIRSATNRRRSHHGLRRFGPNLVPDLLESAHHVLRREGVRCEQFRGQREEPRPGDAGGVRIPRTTVVGGGSSPCRWQGGWISAAAAGQNCSSSSIPLHSSGPGSWTARRIPARRRVDGVRQPVGHRCRRFRRRRAQRTPDGGCRAQPVRRQSSNGTTFDAVARICLMRFRPVTGRSRSPTSTATASPTSFSVARPPGKSRSGTWTGVPHGMQQSFRLSPD